MKQRAWWGRVPEWGQAFLLALCLLGCIHLFVLRWVTVRSTSMYATLMPGDLVAVERWPVWTGLQRGDILVFRDPIQDDRPARERQLLVKRIAGLPGDELQLRAGQLYINGQLVPPAPGQTTSWSVRLKSGTDASALLAALDLPPDLVLPGITVIDLPLNDSLAARLQQRPEVVELAPRGPSARSSNLFPFGPNYKWNNDNYGPLRIPAAGDTVAIPPFTLPLYDRLISRYEHNRLEVAEGQLRINGEPADSYVIQQDHYFVLGDSRDHSSDSRYWGFVPADHVMGRAGFVLLNAHKRGMARIQVRGVN